MYKNLRLFFKLAKINIINQMEYRFSFFFLVLGKLGRLLLTLLFFGVIYLNVDTIAGWSFFQVLMLFATYNLVDLLASMLFSRNLMWNFPNFIESGDLDKILTKPINTQFFISFYEFDVMDMTSLLPAFILLGVAFFKLQIKITLLQASLFLLFMLAGLIFLYSIMLIVSSLAVWTTRLYGLTSLFDTIAKMARIPGDFYKGFVKFFLYYLLPVIIIATVPTQALFGLLDIRYAVFLLIFVFAFFILSSKFFKFALKHYTSVSN